MLTFDPAALPLRDKAAQVRSAPDGEQSCRATLRRDSIPGSEQNLAGCTDGQLDMAGTLRRAQFCGSLCIGSKFFRSLSRERD